MNFEQLSGFPIHPPSVAEWEDLLVRVEIMPRALKANLEEVIDGNPTAEGVLRDLVSRETLIGRWLEEAITERASRDGSESPPDPTGATELRERFARVRARNFAMVQRRGVQIWALSAETRDGYRPTVYQVLGWLARADAHALARIRAARGGSAGWEGGSTC